MGRSIAQSARQPMCWSCGGKLKKATKGNGLARSMFGLGMVLLGLAACLTIVGAIVGIPFIIIGGLASGKQSKIWRCGGCRMTFPRD